MGTQGNRQVSGTIGARIGHSDQLVRFALFACVFAVGLALAATGAAAQSDIAVEHQVQDGSLVAGESYDVSVSMTFDSSCDTYTVEVRENGDFDDLVLANTTVSGTGSYVRTLTVEEAALRDNDPIWGSADVNEIYAQVTCATDANLSARSNQTTHEIADADATDPDPRLTDDVRLIYNGSTYDLSSPPTVDPDKKVTLVVPYENAGGAAGENSLVQVEFPAFTSQDAIDRLTATSPNTTVLAPADRDSHDHWQVENSVGTGLDGDGTGSWAAGATRIVNTTFKPPAKDADGDGLNTSYTFDVLTRATMTDDVNQSERFDDPAESNRSDDQGYPARPVLIPVSAGGETDPCPTEQDCDGDGLDDDVDPCPEQSDCDGDGVNDKDDTCPEDPDCGGEEEDSTQTSTEETTTQSSTTSTTSETTQETTSETTSETTTTTTTSPTDEPATSNVTIIDGKYLVSVQNAAAGETVTVSLPSKDGLIKLRSLSITYEKDTPVSQIGLGITSEGTPDGLPTDGPPLSIQLGLNSEQIDASNVASVSMDIFASTSKLGESVASGLKLYRYKPQSEGWHNPRPPSSSVSGGYLYEYSGDVDTVTTILGVSFPETPPSSSDPQNGDESNDETTDESDDQSTDTSETTTEWPPWGSNPTDTGDQSNENTGLPSDGNQGTGDSEFPGFGNDGDDQQSNDPGGNQDAPGGGPNSGAGDGSFPGESFFGGGGQSGDSTANDDAAADSGTQTYESVTVETGPGFGAALALLALVAVALLAVRNAE